MAISFGSSVPHPRSRCGPRAGRWLVNRRWDLTAVVIAILGNESRERASSVTTIDVPPELAEFRLPEAVHARLQHLLDEQDAGRPLTLEERREAEGLVDLAEFLSLLHLRVTRTDREA